MKFWELTSVMGGERQILETTLMKNEWNEYYDWYLNLDHLCDAQDRTKLDAIVPPALVREILSASKQVFYLHDQQLRSYRFTKDDVEMSALDVFEKFGGTAMDEVLERGSYKVG